MEVLITLVLIGLVIYMLPLLIGAAMVVVSIVGGAILLIYAGISNLFKR